MSRVKKIALILVVTLAVLAGALIVGYRMAVSTLKHTVTQALGPGAEIQEIKVGWSAVTVESLRIAGPRGWPAPDALRTKRVTVAPSLRSLFSDQIRVSSITVVEPYLSVLRTADSKMKVLPGLAPSSERRPDDRFPNVHIARIDLQNAVVELYDASVSKPPLRIRLEQANAIINDIDAPALTSKTTFKLDGVVKGKKQDGNVNVSGWLEPADKNASIDMRLKNVDLVALQPYLVQATDTRVSAGQLDMDLHSKVAHNRLKAPGQLTISDLQFAPGRGVLDTFMGVPRAAIVSFLKDKNDKIAIDFVIEGDLDNPIFALNEAFATRLAASVAGVRKLGQSGVDMVSEALRVSIRGVVEVAKRIGRALVSILGKDRR